MRELLRAYVPDTTVHEYPAARQIPLQHWGVAPLHTVVPQFVPPPLFTRNVRTGEIAQLPPTSHARAFKVCDVPFPSVVVSSVVLNDVVVYGGTEVISVPSIFVLDVPSR